MPTETKLAAILHADVVGSTELVQIDERLAHQRMREVFTRLSGSIARFGGVAHEIRGDALVAEFARASDAVSAALTFQAEATARRIAENARMYPEVRIGIALGEVVIADGTVTGSGVVIAQRLEQLAQPGQVVVQGAVQETVPKRLPVEFERMGDRQLKGFAEPIRAFSVALSDSDAELEPSPADIAAPLLAESSRIPTLAVLPFENLSPDPDQRYFADGIAEDVLSLLGRNPYLLVIARSSSFVYRERAVEVQQIGRDLDVQYALNGSVRRSGNKVRVATQLVECSTARQLWADRFEGALDDVFALQDQIAESVTTALEAQLTEGMQVRVWRGRAPNPSAYEHFQKGRALVFRFDRDANQQAVEELKLAIDSNPDYWDAWIQLGFAHNLASRFGWTDVAESERQEAARCASHVMERAPAFAEAYLLDGLVALWASEHEQAISSTRRAVVLGPNSPDCHHGLAMAYCYAGEPARCLDLERRAITLNPLRQGAYLVELARANLHLGKLKDATECIREVTLRNPRWLAAWTLALAIAAGADDKDQIRVASERIRALDPAFSVAAWGRLFPYRNSQQRDQLILPLLEAGFPT